MTKNRRIILTILVLIGLITTAELIQIYFKANFNANFAPSFCSVNQYIDCDGVAQTPYSLFMGVPLAIWGTILYLIILFLTYVDKINEKLKTKFLTVFKNPRSYIATLGCVSFAISMCLACISIFKINKICILCFATYFLDLIIAFVAKNKGFFVEDFKNTIFDFLAGAKKYLILFIIVCAMGISTLAWLHTTLILSPNLRMMKSFKTFQDMKENIWAIKGNTLGNPDGDIIIYLYSDFMCPYCKLTNTMVHKLAKEQKDVVVYHMNFPLDMECNPILKNSIHPGACLLAKYALAAENQGAYWDITSAIYDKQPYGEKDILNMAKDLNLDSDKLYKDAHSKDTAEKLSKQIQRALNFGIQGTPTIVIDGIEHKSALPYYKMELLTKQARDRHKAEK